MIYLCGRIRTIKYSGVYIGLLFDFCWRSLRLRLKISVHFLLPPHLFSGPYPHK